jgi:hypothetical protein
VEATLCCHEQGKGMTRHEQGKAMAWREQGKAMTAIEPYEQRKWRRREQNTPSLFSISICIRVYGGGWLVGPAEMGLLCLRFKVGKRR